MFACWVLFSLVLVKGLLGITIFLLEQLLAISLTQRFLFSLTDIDGLLDISLKSTECLGASGIEYF